MISIRAAGNAEDFSAAAALCRALGAWDAREAPKHGVPPELVLELYHSAGEDEIVAKYSGDDARIYVARWEGQPAGCIAVSPFDENTFEVGKFYVDPAFRGKGVGRALMAGLLDDAAKSGRGRIVLHTTIYMPSAVSIYRAFGFAECPPFRQVPASVAHSEVFMSRAL
jgi:GNAT superfamily N-acetyltransferase